MRTGQRDVAIVALEGGRFEPREVKLGAQAGDEFEVLEGLAEGDRIVTSAQFLINSESNLQSAISKMRSASEPAAKPMEGHEAMEEEEMAPPAAEEAPAPTHSGHGRE
jgi:Cu(I)/Ag(I) efflux system membrane fusion protein